MSPTDDRNNSTSFETLPPSADFLALVPFDSAWRYRYCAVQVDDDHDLLVTTQDTPLSVIASIAEQLPRECDVARATDEEVCRLIARAYGQSRST